MGVSDPTMALGRATLGQSSTPVYLPGPVDIRGVDRCKRLSLKSIRPTRALTFKGGTWIAEWLFGSMLAETPSIIPGSSSMSAGGPRAKGFLLYVRLPPPNMLT